MSTKWNRFCRSRITVSLAMLAANMILVHEQARAQPFHIESPLYGGVASPLSSDKEQSLEQLMERLSRSPAVDPLDVFNDLLTPSSAGVPMPTSFQSNPPLDATAVYAQNVQSVLYVVAENGDTMTQGSAVAISQSTALTNCHVVMSGKGDPKDPGFRYTLARENIHIMTSSGVEGHAKIVATHPDIDICVIQTPDVALTPVKGVAKFEDIKVGERVYSIGNPKGIAFTIAEGLVSGKRAGADLPHGLHSDVILFSAPVSHGSSGGALFNANGQLVGISQGSIEDAQNVNLAIPADQLWRSHPDRGPGRLGGC